MGKSIYVSIACLGIDTELVKTVKDCHEKAKNSEEIYFGISCIGNIDFFNKIQTELKNIKNIKYGYYPIEGNIGLGFGRNIATSFYNNQDYFLQIDPHSRFIKDWDLFLIKKFKAAQKNVNNQKVVLSGYCPPYIYVNENKDEAYLFPVLEYSPLKPNEFWDNGAIPRWTNIPPQDLPEYLRKMIDETGMAPAAKICAHFIFSNGFFAKNTGLAKEILFWEEEILQSMELINDGFTLIYPGSESAIYHYYQNLGNGVDGYRDTDRSLLQTKEAEKQYIKNMESIYLKHIKNINNLDKVKKYEDYTSISLTYGAREENCFPKQYANIGFLPPLE